jgi:transmembrane sensor
MNVASAESNADIAETAAGWLIRDMEGIDLAARREMERWLAQDPAHAAAFERMRRNWVAAGALGETPAIRKLREESLRPIANTVANDDNEGLSAATVSPAAPQARRWAPWAIAASLIVALGAGGWLAIRPMEPSALVLASGQGERRVFTLADGSQVTLDAKSRLSVRLTGAERRLTLDSGRAYFVVAHDPAHPFVVSAGNRSVVALGTEFGVQQDNGLVTVALTQGRVRVGDASAGSARLRPDTGEDGTELTAGQTLTFNTESGRTTILAMPAEAATGWRNGLLHFDHTPLAGVIAEFNRYGPARIDLVDPSLGSLPVSGQFRAENERGLLDALPLLFPVRVDYRADGTAAISRAAPQKK